MHIIVSVLFPDGGLELLTIPKLGKLTYDHPLSLLKWAFCEYLFSLYNIVIVNNYS
jgi:hypothetical protein